MPSFRAERNLQRQGLAHVAGLDEAGRGAWAGPLVAGAVILPPATARLRRALRGVDDSKRLSASAREAGAAVIRDHAIGHAIGIVVPEELDALGMTAATQLAMRRALAGLATMPSALLIDAFPLPECDLPQRAIVRGDSYSFSIAAASILAKVTRDALMCTLGEQYPAFGFAQHKGYGTKAHQRALAENGPLPVHRRSFAPIAAFANAAAPKPTGAAQ